MVGAHSVIKFTSHLLLFWIRVFTAHAIVTEMLSAHGSVIALHIVQNR